VRREAAIARLRLAGPAAIPRLAALIDTEPDAAIRSAALRALEGMDDRRVDDIALAALASGDDVVAIAALGVMRGRVAGEDGVRALDALTALALDTGRDAAVRLAALDALSELPRELVAPVLDSARAAAREPDAAPVAGDDPLELREWIAAHGGAAPLSTIHDLIARLRERERAEPGAVLRQAWLVTRGAAHALLAQRASRVALYDLRETFDAAPAPLPLDFLTAIAAIGDDSCLEPLARAWAAAPDERWWRERLADAGRDIIRRTRVGARSAVLRRIRGKWPDFLS